MTLQEEIQNGESRTLEYKATLPQDTQKWIKSIVAFANGAGGKFVLGVNNKREFVGLPKTVDLFELKLNRSLLPPGIGGVALHCAYNSTTSNQNGKHCAKHVLYKGNMDYLHRDISSDWPTPTE